MKKFSVIAVLSLTVMCSACSTLSSTYHVVSDEVSGWFSSDKSSKSDKADKPATPAK